MTDATEPTVRYWRHPADPIVVYSTRLDGIAENYDAMAGLARVHVLSDAELDAIKAEVWGQAQDALYNRSVHGEAPNPYTESEG